MDFKVGDIIKLIPGQDGGFTFLMQLKPDEELKVINVQWSARERTQFVTWNSLNPRGRQDCGGWDASRFEYAEARVGAINTTTGERTIKPYKKKKG
jgi:hypothetical protein